jgi:predicted AAA+ superfamily ATPase
MEVDLLVGDHVAIEVKATRLVADKHLKGLRALREELPILRCIVVSRDTTRRTSDDGIEIIPWETFLHELWDGLITGP